MSRIHDRLDEILPRIQEESFMEGKGLGNEVGYYVFDYEPEDELLVRDHVQFVKEKMNNKEIYPDIIEFNLYHVMLDILEDKGYLRKIMKMEESRGTDKALNGLKSSLRLTSSGSNSLVKYITDKVSDDQIVFITGVGQAWPVIRSHTVLNNLHQVLDSVPVVMFFPGEYSGSELILFGKIKDDNYYRAFRLVE
ncbi:protein of unknown function (DUF1788) [Halobacteroides halobius DSM 5150]|uniref:DUF1788 domain-containing protein n=1 Tax=Halobacteroides halobius (strain ATCC 35273 / DSM 5150 / MD-1) TaxID=748449 RepID=L0K7Q1_HALHC|nr:DUF1788 domain-containing protein [Halobacteroides halobius]AGB41051.1 protein of unknown function (DUF1788) [Halobacteroides halobius DSM 5150]